MNKKISLGLTLSLMALVASLTFVLTFAYANKAFNLKVSEVDRLSEKYGKLAELNQAVDDYFYTEPDDDKLMDGMLAGYVAGLQDPYSAFLTAEQYSERQDQTAGVYTGIGISAIPTEQQEILIVSVTKGGPADEAGLVPDDVIVRVENLLVSDDYSAAIDAITGEAGTRVNLTVRKAASNTEKRISVVRRSIDETTVTSSMLDNHIGYIHISKFRSVSVNQFLNAMTELQKTGAEGFLFDVRENGGGLLSALEAMVDPLLPEGELAHAYFKNGERQAILTSDANQLEMPIVVLMNGNTASASELFACVLRDYAGAVLVGEKSFGKGIMQTTFPLSDGSAVILTNATYATEKTPCYHGIGLEPDVKSSLDTDAEEDTQLADAQSVLLDLIKKAS